ncbi:MAG: hypothetical protein AAF639_45245 [Chloroflexota bacterium]
MSIQTDPIALPQETEIGRMPVLQATRPSPYIGLEPYTEEKAAYFFGRDRETALIADNLEVRRLTLLYGPSGVGKSSILRAGVMAQFLERADAQRQYGGTPGSPIYPEYIPIYFNRWQQDPLLGLSQTISNTGILPVSATDTATNTATGRMPALLSQLQQVITTTDSDLLLILDQFEEYFQYRAQYTDPPADMADFGTQLIQLINHRSLRVNILISLREDALAKLDHFKGHIPTLLDNRMSISHLTRKAGEAAITEPNKQHSTNYAIEPSLVTTILDQVGRLDQETETTATPLRDEIQAPYLQLVLTRLWDEEAKQGAEQLRQSTLDALGGSSNIVDNYLNELLDTLSDAERQLALRFFDRLVTPSGTKIALTMDELVFYATEPEQDAPQTGVTALVKRLQNWRLLNGVRTPKGDDIQYEIFHDVLGKSLLDWQERQQEKERLAEEERRFAQEEQARKEAEERATLAQALAATEKRRVQQSRWALAVVSLLLLIAIILATIISDARQDAVAAEKDAVAAEETAVAARRIADANADEARRAHATADFNLQEKQKSQRAQRRLLSNELHNKLSVYSNEWNDDETLIIARDAALVTWVNEQPVSETVSETLHATLQRTALIQTLPGKQRSHQGAVNSIAFSPDGDFIVSGSTDTTVRLWNAETLEHIGILYGHTGTVWSVAFNRDGTKIVSGGEDNAVHLWDAKTREHLKELVGHTEAVRSVAFSPDDKYVISGSEDDTVRMWEQNDTQNTDEQWKQWRQFDVDTSSTIWPMWISDDNHIFIANASRTVCAWNRHKREEYNVTEQTINAEMVRSVTLPMDSHEMPSSGTSSTDSDELSALNIPKIPTDNISLTNTSEVKQSVFSGLHQLPLIAPSTATDAGGGGSPVDNARPTPETMTLFLCKKKGFQLFRAKRKVFNFEERAKKRQN